MFGTSTSQATKPDILHVGDVVQERWEVQTKIGRGRFGEVYRCLDLGTRELVAIKVESAIHPYIMQEVEVLKALQAQRYVCRYIGSGKTARYNYLAMELLGKSLDELRNMQIQKKFTLSTTVRVGLQVLRLLEAIHGVGYLHCDVRANNFAIGRITENNRNIFMIDFGISEKINSDSYVFARSKNSTQYKTVHYMDYKHDLQSLFNLIAEFVIGQQTWFNIVCKNQHKTSGCLREFLKHLPPEFERFSDHVETLNSVDKPNYSMLATVFQDCMERLGIKITDPFDWEQRTTAEVQEASAAEPSG